MTLIVVVTIRDRIKICVAVLKKYNFKSNRIGDLKLKKNNNVLVLLKGNGSRKRNISPT